MNKGKITAIAVTALLLLPTVTVYAKEKNNKSTAKASVQKISKANVKSSKATNAKATAKTKKDEKKAEVEANKAQIAAFKKALKQKHDTMNQIRKDTIAVKKQVEQKKAELSGIITALESGSKTLPQDQLSQVMSMYQAIKSDGDKLSDADKIVVNAVVDNAAKSDNLGNALFSLDKVITRMQLRLDVLKKLNMNLDSILVIARQATIPTPVVTTPPADAATPVNVTTPPVTTPIDTTAPITTAPIDATTTATETLNP